MRRSTVLTLPLQLVFPGKALITMGNMIQISIDFICVELLKVAKASIQSLVLSSAVLVAVLKKA